MAKSKTKGWLDSYQEGGVESTQAGYTDIPFRYNSAWGGQFEEGGYIPQAQDGWLEKLKGSVLNPYNWGVEDYSKEKDFNKAYSIAKKAGEKEFIYKGKRFNTKYAGTPRQEVGTYGVDGKPVHPMGINHPAQVTSYPAFGKYLPGHISAMLSPYESASVDYSSAGNNPYGINAAKNKGEHSYYVYGADRNKFYEKAATLPSGDYMLEDKYTPSDWNLFTNNCADNVCDAFGIPRSKGIQTPFGAMSKIKEKYPTLDVTGRTYDDYENLYRELQNQPNKKILSQSKNILGIASSPDLQQTDISKKLISTIQGVLADEGFAPSKSQKESGGYDGIYGPDTKKALENWQKKNKSFAMGGSIPGSVGFTYARTNSPAPSNGPYAKKTKASAQNGQEMSFYQHGLDWKPKSISKNGGWLDKYIPEAQDGREQVEQNFQVSKDFLKDWYTQRAELPQFTDIASARAADIDRFSYGYQPYNYMKKSGSFAYYPGRGGDKVYFTDPNDPNIPPHNPSVAYPEVISHELVHGLARKNPQIEGVDYTPVSIKEFNPVYKDQKNRTAENYGWINVEAPAEVTNEKGKTKLKRLPGAETEGTFAMLRMAEKLDPKKTYTAEDMTAIVEKYKNMSKEYIDDPKNHKDYIIHTMMANYGFDPARLAELQNSIVMNESAQPPMAQKGMFIPGVTDFKPMGNASESTSIVRNTPKGQVSTSTTGATKQQMKEQSDAMMRQTKREEEEKKARIAERKSAVASRDKNKPFTFPTGETKTYDQMNWREKNYVAGKALEQRGRFNENDETFFDEWINPINLIGSTAGAIGTAPLEAKMYDSNLPYVGAIASPLIAGAFGFDPLGGAMKVPSKVAQSMESGVLSNIHKVNPFAGTFAGESKLPNFLQFNKLDDPNAFWRLTKDPKNFGLAEGAYFNKGVPLTKELAETFPKGSRASTHRYSGPKWNPKTGKMDLYDGSDYLFKVGDEKFMEPHLNFPEPHLKFYRQSGNIPEGQSQMFKKDWLQGWKEVPKPDIPFKSEINWGAWNSEIPSNKALMNEYAAIEKTSKANGSWMKNPDGSPFQGTPEQFVQQNSENFKKAFPQGATTGYRGAHFHVDDFANRQRNDYATFLTDSERNAETYAGSDRSSKTYYHPDINTSGEAVDGMYQLGIPNNFPRVKGSADQRSWRLLNWDDKIGAGVEDNFAEDHNNYLKKIFERGELKDYGIEGYDPSKKYLSTDAYANYVKNANNPEAIAEIKNVKDQMGYATDIPSNTVYAVDANRVPLKSLRYNNGMFDMTNPNIYKALVPAVIGAGVIGSSNKESDKKKKGGVIKDDRGQWAHPGEITEIGSNRITMQGVPYPVLGISNTGDTQMMYPGEEYKFKGNKVTEFPITQKVNKKENGGWLNQYK